MYICWHFIDVRRSTRAPWLCIFSMCVSCTCTVDLRLHVSYRFWSSSLTHQVNYHVWHFLHYWFDVVVFTVMVCFTSWLSVMLWLCFVLYSVHVLWCLPFVSLEWCLCSLCVFCTLVVVVRWALKMTFYWVEILDIIVWKTRRVFPFVEFVRAAKNPWLTLCYQFLLLCSNRPLEVG